MRKTMKRVLGLALVLVMVLSMLPMTALAAGSATAVTFPTSKDTSKQNASKAAYYLYNNHLYKVEYKNGVSGNVNVYYDSNNNLKLGGNYNKTLFVQIGSQINFSAAKTSNLPGSENGKITLWYEGPYSWSPWTEAVTITCVAMMQPTEANWTWNGTSSATLTLSTNNGITVTVNATLTPTTTPGADCQTKGSTLITATASFNGKTYTDTKTVEGEYGAHPGWNAATCYDPETCTLCGADKEGSAALDHDWSDNNGICKRDNSHTCDHDGQAVGTCSICGKQLHVHSFTYAANSQNAAQIVETCTNGCDHKGTATLVYAYGNGTYDYTGSAITPLKVVYDNWNGGQLTIEYSNNIEVSRYQNAANGKISIEIGGSSSGSSFGPFWPYFPPYNPTPTPTPNPTPTKVEATLSFTIVRPANAWTAGPSIEGWTYGEEANAYVAEAKYNNETLKVEYRPASAGDDAYTTEVPTAAGSYKVRFTVEGTNIYDALIEVLDLTIAPAPVTVTAVDGSKIYGEADPTLTYTVGTLVGEDTLTGITVARAEGENVDTYAITAAQAAGANSNYEITFVPATFTISEKEIAFTWGDTTDLPYTGSSLAPAATATNLEDGDECTLTVAVVETAEGAGIVPGTWTAKVTALSNDNYKLPENVETSFNIVKANQAAPAVAGVDETVDGKADGKITGVDSTMEYRKAAEAELMLLSDPEYTPITGTELTGLEDGTYFVRRKGNDNYNASPETMVTIKAGAKLTVTVPDTQVGYTLTSDATELVWQGDATITFALAEGYSKTEAFAVKVNGTAVELDADGKYAIVDAEENIVVTVEGVADITAPTAEVAIATNKWNTFLSTITFGIFYKDAQTVTVTAADANLDKVYYYVANAAMAEADVQAITEWTEYTAAFKIDPSNEYVVYVKAVDKSGNTTYVSSDGVVIDAIAPEISGIVNKGTYYYNTQFGVSDKYLDTVTVDGKEVELKDGKYTIIADGKSHTIVATDKVGNSTTVKITVLSTANAVPTGDDSNLWLWVVVLFMSAVGLTGTIAYDRKKKNVK